MTTTCIDLRELTEGLPPIIARSEVKKLLGGAISSGYLANLDCQGQGPERFKIGKRVCYTRESLIAFLQRRVSCE